jgi:carboxymethylenebutenolidase
MHFVRHLSFVCLGAALILRVSADDNEGDSTPAAKLAGRTITLSDFGDEDLAYLSVPMTAPVMGIILVPDAYGLDDFTKTEADRLAGLGYLTMAIDIYNGHHTTDPEQIANLVANQETAAAMKTIDAAIRVFQESPKFHVGHIILMGWGNGARFVFQAARNGTNFDGGIMFYGPVETNVERIGRFAVPLCAVYPDNDPVITHDEVQVFEHMMRDAGNDFEAWFIAAGRGWSNPASKTYNPVEDKEAWKVVLPFLVRIGAEPVKPPKKPSIIDQAKDKIENIFK